MSSRSDGGFLPLRLKSPSLRGCRRSACCSTSLVLLAVSHKPSLGTHWPCAVAVNLPAVPGSSARGLSRCGREHSTGYFCLIFDVLFSRGRLCVFLSSFILSSLELFWHTFFWPPQNLSTFFLSSFKYLSSIFEWSVFN